MENYTRLFSIMPFVLTACTSMTSLSASFKDGVSVSLQGMNYTERPFSYVVSDPKDPRNAGGGEIVEAYSAGGIVCCYTLPKKWSPGMKVQVRAIHWLPKDSDGKLPELTRVVTVEVPPYASGEVGNLWVLRTKDGDIEVVSSNHRPNHAKWPGKVKGWPEPDVAYRRKRWELEYDIAEDNVRNSQGLLKQLGEEPEMRARLASEHAKKYNFGEDLTKYSGPSDPSYQAYLRKRYETNLMRSEQELKLLIEHKP